MPLTYTDPKTQKPVDLTSFGDAGAQNLQANKMGYDVIPVSSSAIAPASALTLPTQQLAPAVDVTTSQAIIDAQTKAAMAKPKETPVVETPPPTAIESFLSKLTPQASQVDAYNTAYGASGLATQEQDILAKQQTVKTAQGKLATLNAQLGAINAEATAIPIQIQKEAEARGVTAGGMAPIQSSRLRDNALKALPLQAQALVAQAEVQSAQGDVQLAQDSMNMAKDRLTTLFNLQVKDSENTYNYQKDLRDKLLTYATAEQKTLLDAKQKEADQNFQLMRDDINNAQTLAKTALDAGQSNLAARITQLDPKSATYREDLAALQGEIRVPQKVAAGSAAITPMKQIDTTLPSGSSDYLDQLFSANIGGKKPTQVETLRPIQKTLAVASQLGELSSLIKDTKTDPILGALRSMNPYDFDVRAIQATLQATVPNLARGVYGEVGVLTDQDIKNYIQTLPNIKGTKAQNDFVLGMTLRSLQNGLLGQLEVLQGAGYDISGFRNSYDKLVNQSNKIEKDLGITKSVDVAPEKASVFDSIVEQPQQGGYFSNLWKAITGQ